MSKITKALVEHISPLTDSILKLILAPKTYLDYQAGQYLQICEGRGVLFYSIANAPLGSQTYELHIRHEKTNQLTQTLLATIKKKGELKIKLPLGDCHLERLDASRPLIFVAGGTGFAPIKAMIEQLLANGEDRKFKLYWSARTQSDLYMDEKLSQWKNHVAQFSYVSLLSSQNLKENLSQLIIDEHKNELKNYQIVLGGSFDMVYAIRDRLVEAGVSASDLFSDAFSKEP